MQQELATPPKPPSLRRALLLATLLVLWDAFWVNQGVTAVIVGLFVLLVGLPRAFLAKFAAVRPQRLRNLAVYVTAVVLVCILNLANNRLAQSRAEVLVAAVKAFHLQHQRYPNTLNELVPEFIGHVPLAKYSLSFHTFRYMTSEHGTLLSYTSIPPFGRPLYSFTRNEWGYLD